jgi:hypothetical protein
MGIQLTMTEERQRKRFYNGRGSLDSLTTLMSGRQLVHAATGV